MDRDDVVRALAANAGVLAGMGVRSLSLFGSVARDEATAESDVDILVDFGEPASFDAYMDLKFYLEDLLGARVDLVTERGLKPGVRPYVQQDAIRVA
jgi:predicted nucleotidyltransferase